MSVHLHRARRADRLVDALAEVLADPLDDPFAEELVVVPTRGVERWLAQRLARRLGRTGPDRTDGVCAGVGFRSPTDLVATVTAAGVASGSSGGSAGDDPWRPRRLVWPVLDVLTEGLTEPWAAPVRRFLRRSSSVAGSSSGDGHPDGAGGRRLALARHTAALFDDYAANRPALVRAWASGSPAEPTLTPELALPPEPALPPELAWQPECWRRVRARVGAPGPAERLPELCRRVREEPALVDLPERLSVFGPTRLTPAVLDVLTALAVHRDVHLWLPHPSPALWAAVREVSDGFDGPRRGDPTAAVPRHRLLAYLGRDVRELQLRLGGLEAATDHDHDRDDHALDDHGRDDRAVDDHGRNDHVATTLLAQLQSDIAADHELTPTRTPLVLDPEDHSVGVHACHGPDRQVEVLRELLLGRLADDPTLEPRDIVVMCPDIETFAPLISAAFGIETEELDSDGTTSEAGPRWHPGHRLRVRLADRSLRRLNPMLAVLGRVFELAEDRVDASTVLDLCASPPVAARFGFTDEQLQRLRDLVIASGVRWGLDAADRDRFGLGQFGQNTWRAGLDRLLLGVAMDEEGQHFLGTTLPLDDVDSGDVVALGQLAEVVDRLRDLLTRLEGRRPVGGWLELCRDVLDLLCLAPPGESWQAAQAYGELARLAETAPADGAGAQLTRAEARVLLADVFGGRPTRSNFRTGTLTVCTMLPMRSVPHRVVCLLGVDDGVFPRAGGTDGDDLLALDPWVGDRDGRSEDRQLMLDAITAAEQQLLVVYSGADPRTNAVRPPSVPVGELLDVLDLTARTVDGDPARAQVLHRHPLQPFDPADFATAGDGPVSFDRAALDGALALTRAATPRAATSGASSLRSAATDPRPLPEVVELDDLVRFLQHPPRAYLRARAGLSTWSASPPAEEIPVELDALERWGVGDRLLALHLRGTALDTLAAAEWRRGTLPPRALGAQVITPVTESVHRVAAVAEPHLTGERRQHDLQLDLPESGLRSGGRVLTGTVSTVASAFGPQLVDVSFSKLGPKHRLAAWVRLLALTAAEPELGWRAVVVGADDVTRLGPVPPMVAMRVLGDLVDLWATGLAEPLPLPLRTSAEYAAHRERDRPVEHVVGKLRRTWERDADEAFALCFGSGVTLERLLELPGRPEEARNGRSEPSRLGTLALRVWAPLLRGEGQP